MPEVFVQKASELLLKNDIGIGLKAGYYYPDFWVRDGLISSMGLSLSGDARLEKIAKACIQTAAKFQRFTGQMPNKVTPDGKKICFGEGGCIDSSLWYPIAAWNYFKSTKDLAFLKEHHKRVEHAMGWAICLDQNSDWMIETNFGSDWMDMLLRSGRVLYDNVLLYKALKDADEINRFLGFEQKWGWIAENLREHINMFLWPTQESLEEVRTRYGHTGLEKDVETVMSNEKGERNFYLAELGFRTYDPRFDAFANTLAVLFDVAPKDRRKKILDAIESELVNKPYPIKVLHPAISRYDPFWNFYFRWTDLPCLQEPGNFHNGGIWPFAGGFYIAALKKEKRPYERAFDSLVKSCEMENWRFPEWIGPDGKPGGSADQTWSAAMLIYAHFSK
ncbi:MAG: hypothetical protein JW727_06990 [Candidatus Aenigmarchaeota archaeon]|nr:hypothetical protein [Candidatus Aenigmarchaeota archaeon]